MVQNLKTEPEQDTLLLPDLEPQQFEFVQQIVFHGKKIVVAYRIAYNPSDPNAPWVQVEASRLRNSPKVSLWIDELRKQQIAVGPYSLEAHLAELDAAVVECRQKGNLGAMVNAIGRKGQASGHYVSLHEDITKRNRSPAEMIAEAEATLGKEVADMLAKKLGVERLPKAKSA